ARWNYHRGGRYRVLVFHDIRGDGPDGDHHSCRRRDRASCCRGDGPRRVFPGALAGGPKPALTLELHGAYGGGTISMRTMRLMAIKACRPRATTRSSPSSSLSASPSSSPSLCALSKYH